MTVTGTKENSRIQAVIFTFGYFFLSLSTWFVGKTFFETTLTYAAVANILGLSYRPLRWVFLSAMPSSKANQRPRS